MSRLLAFVALVVGCSSTRDDTSSSSSGSSASARADSTKSSPRAGSSVGSGSSAAGSAMGTGSERGASAGASASPPFDIRQLAELSVIDPVGRSAPLGGRLRDVNLLAFWASWCKPCIAELPKLDKLYASERGGARVAMIAINLDDANSRAAAQKAIAQLHLAMPVVFDPDAETYNVLYPGPLVVIPAVAVVSKGGALDTRGGPSEEPTDALITRYRTRIDAGLAGKLGTP